MDDIRRITAAIASGDPDAFAVLYRARFDRCFALARRFTGLDEAACLDIVQDSMMRIIRTIRPVENEARLDAFLASVVRSVAVDRIRRERRRRARELAAATAIASADHASLPERSEALAWLRTEIARLDVVSAELLAARLGAGATLARSGARVGLRPAAAHGRLARVLERLRSRGNRAGHE